ncbi:MAG: hypothetical protein IJI25_05855 [Eubacterium sp.]|nr:hypothetical protein [Eubacterium sp.]
MNQVPIKLGPLTLLLTVISICLTTLAILTFTTARADMRLSEKYARMVSDRYELEIQGQTFMRDLSDTLARGGTADISDIRTDKQGVNWKTFEKEGSRLQIGYVLKDGRYRIIAWKQDKAWDQDMDIGNLW